MKTAKQLEKELTNIRKTLKAFWTLINNDENLSIYISAAAHGVRLNETYLKKVMPLNKKLKKFMGI